MKTYPFYQVDAFASKPFEGNPAGVVILEEWLSDTILQNIASENYLPETAFLVKKGQTYEIRWFSPKVEVELCGHATLASAHVLFSIHEKDLSRIQFETRYSGILYVEKNENRLELDFPADSYKPVELPEELIEAIGEEPVEGYLGRSDYLLVYKSQQQIENLDPDFYRLRAFKARGIITTAPGTDVDFVSRFFAPAIDIDEDPVTGSAHTTLMPYWSSKFNRNELKAVQLSKRGGSLYCRLEGDRVKIGGEAVIFIAGEISIPV